MSTSIFESFGIELFDGFRAKIDEMDEGVQTHDLGILVQALFAITEIID